MSKKRFQRGVLRAMAPGARRGSARAHHQLIGLFTIAAAFLLVVNVAIVTVPGTRRVQATKFQNVTGWAWSSTGGWLSMNDTNTGAGNYGVTVTSERKIAGFAWSSNSGWVCFGASCSHPLCHGMAAPDNASSTASLDTSYVMHGWAKFCNLGDDGWISLNCANRSECGASNYAVTYSTSTGFASGYAWHGKTPNGWGWMDFSAVKINLALTFTPEGPDIVRCRDGKDNDGNGLIDCFDPSCTGVEPACPAVETHCSLIGQTNCCDNGVDDDFDGLADCADTADCSADPLCAPIDCSVGGAVCADPRCVNKPGCELCTDTILNISGTTTKDCANAMCATYFPGCTPAWFQSKYGNVYAKAGVTGNPPPPGMANATYCITSTGNIIQAKSETGCVEPLSSENVSLPANGNGYATSLGRLDVAGILSGRYGTVKSITDQSGLEMSPLGGKVFVYDGTASCPAGGFLLSGLKTFYNAVGQNAKGSGLLVIKGCDLKITGNMSYDTAGISASNQYLRNLASFGILVLCRYSSGSCVAGTGNITIASGVTGLVGTMYAERSISTGSTGSRLTDQPLQVYGALVAHQVNLQRQASSPSTPAEQVIFDGRSVVNPPPGYQDISKSLPAVGDKY